MRADGPSIALRNVIFVRLRGGQFECGVNSCQGVPPKFIGLDSGWSGTVNNQMNSKFLLNTTKIPIAVLAMQMTTRRWQAARLVTVLVLEGVPAVPVPAASAPL